MADDVLRAKIALDGAKDVGRQLADLGKAGEQAFKQIGEASKSASQGVNSSQSLFGQLASAFQSAVSQIAGAGAALGGAFDPLISAAGNGLAAASRAGAGFGAIAIAAAGISGSIGKIGQEAANSVAKLNDAAVAAGLTMEKYSALRAAFEGVGVGGDVLDKMVEASEKAARGAELKGAAATHFRRAPGSAESEGVDADGADKAAASVGKLTESILGAERAANELPHVLKAVNGAFQEFHAGDNKAQGPGGYAQAAAELGVALRDMYGQARPGIEIARDVVLSLGKMADGARRADIAARAFGEGLGRQVLAVADNREAINELAAAHERSAATMSDAQKKQADDARATGAILASVKASWIEYFRALATPVTIDQNNAIIVFFERNKAALKNFGDNVIGPAIRWLGQFQNAFGAVALAAGALGGSLGLLSPIAATAFGAAGLAAIGFGDKITNGALAAMTELTRIVKVNDLSTFAGWKGAAIAVWEDIKQIALDAWAAIRQRVAAVDWAGAWASFKATALDAWNSLRAQIAAIDWASIWASLKAGAVALFDELVALAAAAWSRIADAFASVDLSALWTAFVARAGEAFARVAEIARDGYQAIRAAALAAFPGLTGAWETMERVAGAVFASLRQMSGATWLAIGLGLLGFTGLFGGSFSTILALAAPFWRQILEGAIELVPGLRLALAPIATAFADAFAAALPVVQTAWAYLRALMSGDKTLVASAWSGLAESAALAWGRIEAIFSAGYAALRAQMIGAFEWLRAPWLAVEDAVASAWRAIKAEHDAGWPTLKGIWDNLAATFHGVKAAADMVAGAINLIFRTNYSGTQLLLIAVLLQVVGLAPVVIEIVAAIALSFELFGLAVRGTVFIVTSLPAALSLASAALQGLGVAFGVLAANPWALLIIAAVVAIGVALYALYAHWGQIKSAALDAWSAIAAGAAAAWAAIKAAPQNFFAWIEAKFEALKALAGAVWDKFKDAANGAWDAVKQAFSSALGWIEAKWDALIAKIKGALASVGIVSGAASGASGGDQATSASSGGSAGGFAGGGLIAGPGSGTSDSILARLSNGEFVVSARAVGAFGADFFHTLNNLTMPGFSLGGLVGAPALASVPAFASGGAVGGAGRSGLVSFPLDLGGQHYELFGHKDTVSELQRHSALRQMSATTKRAPGWNR